ncbi:MAG: hypothetical protein WC852_06310 [Candidatus Nanoarchaeia archaeon]|jgi:hypothetical protein
MKSRNILATVAAAGLAALVGGCQSGDVTPRSKPQQTQAFEQLPYCRFENQYLTGQVIKEEFHENYALLIATSKGDYALEITGRTSSLALLIDVGDIVKFVDGKKITNGPCDDIAPESPRYLMRMEAGEFLPRISESRRGEIYTSEIELVEKAEQ